MAHPRARAIAVLAGTLALAFQGQAGNLKSDERVVFFPTLGQRVGNEWELEIHGWVFEPERRTVAVALFRKALGLEIGELSDEEEIIFNQRARLFLVDNERGKRVPIQIAGHEYRLGPSAANGHFTNRVRVPADAEPAGAILLADKGLSVISDIDDTIKISEVRDRRALLHHTFCQPF